MVIIDGNDGVGKTTIINKLKHFNVYAKDRGFLTELTINPCAHNTGELCILLDLPIYESQKRLIQRGADITEKYHTLEDLYHYRYKFLTLANKFNNVFVVNADDTVNNIVDKVLFIIFKNKDIMRNYKHKGRKYTGVVTSIEALPNNESRYSNASLLNIKVNNSLLKFTIPYMDKFGNFIGKTVTLVESYRTNEGIKCNSIYS